MKNRTKKNNQYFYCWFLLGPGYTEYHAEAADKARCSFRSIFNYRNYLRSELFSFSSLEHSGKTATTEYCYRIKKCG